MSCNKPSSSGCTTPGCGTPECVAADCMLELGDCLTDNAGNVLYTAVFCPDEYQARYVTAGFMVLHDNSGAFMTMLRKNAGSTCGINFSVPFRNNSGRTIGFLPPSSDCGPDRVQPPRCAENAITTATAVLASVARCANVALPTGTFTNATVVVNRDGCISSIRSGTPELYTPDECCGNATSSGGGAGVAGPRGLPGAAATVTVDEAVMIGQTWAIKNVGTTAAAVLQLTVPASLNTAATTNSITGATGNVRGLRVESGLVKGLPSEIVTDVEVAKQGSTATLYSMAAYPSVYGTPGTYEVQVNLDGIKLDYDQLINAQKQRIDALTQALGTLTNQFNALQLNFNTLQQDHNLLAQNVSAMNLTVGTTANDLNALTNRYNTHTTHPVP